MSIVTGPMEIGESVCIKPSLPKKQAALSRNPLQRQAKRGWRLARRCDTGAVLTDRTVALLVAAGQGSRAGGDIGKKVRLIGGKTVQFGRASCRVGVCQDVLRSGVDV